jgi:hypothetical protein
MKKISIIMTIILIMPFTYTLNAFMAGNESCLAFQQGCLPGPGFSLTSGDSIAGLIAQGGYYFLKASSNLDELLSLVEISEISGPDYPAMQTAAAYAADNMQKARDIYYRLKNLAAVSPYNQTVIVQLAAFDYTSFQKERLLIPVIFLKVKKFLCAGDVRGVYNEFYANAGKLAESLLSLKKDVDNGTLPGLSNLWRIQQGFAEDKLFSQYVAEVFYSLK